MRVIFTVNLICSIPTLIIIFVSQSILIIWLISSVISLGDIFKASLINRLFIFLRSDQLLHPLLVVLVLVNSDLQDALLGTTVFLIRGSLGADWARCIIALPLSLSVAVQFGLWILTATLADAGELESHSHSHLLFGILNIEKYVINKILTYLKNSGVIISHNTVVHQVLNRILPVDHPLAVLPLDDKERLIHWSWVDLISLCVLRFGRLRQWI